MGTPILSAELGFSGWEAVLRRSTLTIGGAVKKCFVLMPFAPEYEEVFEHAIRPAAENAGYECSRADDALGPSSIVRGIIEGLFEADVIVADLSSHNPNVFYELGIAHVLGNKTIAICRNDDAPVPFDLKTYKTIFYSPNIDGIQTELRSRIDATIRSLPDWGGSPSNPVQDYRTVDYALPLKGQGQLEEEAELLRAEIDHLSRSVGRPAFDSSRMELVNSGSFQMGSDEHKENEAPEHKVDLGAFLMDVYPVTNGQFKRFVESEPRWGKESVIEEFGNIYYLLGWRGAMFPRGKIGHPVVYVSWFAAAAYCNWRSREEGLAECYEEEGAFACDYSQNGYRLATEAEYEKAARGGLEGAMYPWGDRAEESRANFENVVGDTTEVGRYPANGFGLYDMAGNVWEWCGDIYDAEYYGSSPELSPCGAKSGEFRVFRGGSWASEAVELRCSYRGWLPPENTNPDCGFRCVRRA